MKGIEAKARRESAGWTVELVAEVAGVRPELLQRFEDGGRIRWDQVRAIAEALELLRLEPPIAAPTPAPASAATEASEPIPSASIRAEPKLPDPEPVAPAEPPIAAATVVPGVATAEMLRFAWAVQDARVRRGMDIPDLAERCAIPDRDRLWRFEISGLGLEPDEVDRLRSWLYSGSPPRTRPAKASALAAPAQAEDDQVEPDEDLEDALPALRQLGQPRPGWQPNLKPNYKPRFSRFEALTWPGDKTGRNSLRQPSKPVELREAPRVERVELPPGFYQLVQERKRALGVTYLGMARAQGISPPLYAAEFQRQYMERSRYEAVCRALGIECSKEASA